MIKEGLKIKQRDMIVKGKFIGTKNNLPNMIGDT